MRQLFMVRHAHRETSQGRLKDNGLSSKGEGQAKDLAKFLVGAVKDKDDLAVLSSPKKRCIETLEPFAKKMGTEVSIDPLLDEGGDLNEKIDHFIHQWKFKGSQATVICTHGDWLPQATERLLGLAVDFKKGAVCELRQDDQKHLVLHQMIQEPS